MTETMLKTTNDLYPESAFKERLIYSIIVGENITNEYYFDFHNKDYLYGKINTGNDSIFVKDDLLENIDENGNRLLPFVAEAWREFNAHVLRLEQLKKITPDSFLRNLSVSRSYEDVHENYYNYMLNMYNSNIQNYVTGCTFEPDRFNDIFVKLCESSNGTNIQTRTGYIASTKASIMTTGMALEIKDYEASNNAMKDLKFFQDPIFKFYVKSLAKFAFKIDKNIPWRIVFDLSSPNAMKYIGKYVNTKTQLFERFFFKAEEYDLLALQRLYYGFYNHYLVDQKKKTFVLTEQEYLSNFTDLYWLTIYADIRSSESMLRYEDKVHVRNSVKTIFKYKDLPSVIAFINNEAHKRK